MTLLVLHVRKKLWQRNIY